MSLFVTLLLVLSTVILKAHWQIGADRCLEFPQRAEPLSTGPLRKSASLPLPCWRRLPSSWQQKKEAGGLRFHPRLCLRSISSYRVTSRRHGVLWCRLTAESPSGWIETESHRLQELLRSASQGRESRELQSDMRASLICLCREITDWKSGD